VKLIVGIGECSYHLHHLDDSEAALERRESRGAHVRLDFPSEDPALAHRMPCPAQPQTV